MFIEHTPEALSPEVLGRCFPLQDSQCFYFLLSSVNFSSVIIQEELEEHWKSISQFRQLCFCFFLLNRILLSVNSSSSEIHCVIFRILSLQKTSLPNSEWRLFNKWHFWSVLQTQALITSPVTVGLHLSIKPLLICIWFCLFILIAFVCNDFTCTTQRKKVFFLSDSSHKPQHCMYIHIYVQTVWAFFRATCWLLENANTCLISLSASCPYRPTIHMYEEKKKSRGAQFLLNGETAASTGYISFLCLS